MPAGQVSRHGRPWATSLLAHRLPPGELGLDVPFSLQELPATCRKGAARVKQGRVPSQAWSDAETWSKSHSKSVAESGLESRSPTESDQQGVGKGR